MFVRQVALVSEGAGIPVEEVTRIAAALQKQVTRDFAPIWQVPVTVDGFPSLDDVPLGYWPVIVIPAEAGAAPGVHLDKDGQPYALVEAGDSWSLAASHETMEMALDPFGNRMIAGPSPSPDQGRVEFLVEVCDPSEAPDWAYTVNDVLVSDFYTPHYFDPVAQEQVRYSYTGAITEPRQVLPGGYLSWHDITDDRWYQLKYFGEPEFKNLGVLARNGQSLRAVIDSLTPETKRLSHLPRGTDRLRGAVEAASSAERASRARAVSLRQQYLP